jgi:hypothetical protein
MLAHSWWEYKLVQPFLKNSTEVSQKKLGRIFFSFTVQHGKRG